MLELVEKIIRVRKQRRIASVVFVVAILVLYVTNVLIRAFAYHDDVWRLIWNFLPALLLGISVYLTGWLHGGVESSLQQLKNVSLAAVFAPAVATFFSFLTYEAHYDRVDFGIAVFAMLSMCVTPYALKELQTAWMAILAQAVWFVLLAAHLGNNAAAIVAVFLTALVLIWQIPRRCWRWRFEPRKKNKMTMALITLLIAAFVLIVVRETGVMEAIILATYGRPGLDSSATVNRECAEMLQTAKFFGSTPNGYCTEVIFENRVLTMILTKAGWLAVIPTLLAIVAMIGSGFFLCSKQDDARCHCSAAFLSAITIQTVGYMLMCAGWDELLFPELCPFLDGDISRNSLFMLMAVWLLPPAEDLFPWIELVHDYDEYDDDTDAFFGDETDEQLPVEADLEAVLKAEEEVAQDRTVP